MTSSTPDPRRDRHPGLTSPTRLRRIALLAALAALVVGLDQATKWFVRMHLLPGETWPEGWALIRVAHVQNTGAAFGIFSGATDILAAATVVAVIVVCVLIVVLAGTYRWYAACLSLVLGGAIGNLIDRVRLGAVTDFIDPMAYPAFNIADSAIVIGVGTLLLFAFLDRGEEQADGAADRDVEAAEASYPGAAPAAGGAFGHAARPDDPPSESSDRRPEMNR